MPGHRRLSRAPAAATKCRGSGCLLRRQRRTTPCRAAPASEAASPRSGRARPEDRTPLEGGRRPGNRTEAGAPAHRAGTGRRRRTAWVTSEILLEFLRTQSGLSGRFRPSWWRPIVPLLEHHEGGRAQRRALQEGCFLDVTASRGGFMSRLPWMCVALCMVTVMIPPTVRADVVLDWNAHAARAIVTVGGQVPPRALIRLAMVHLAIYDAVNAIEGVPFESYASVPSVDRPASAEAAAATAAHDVLVALFPAQMADLDAKYAASLAVL